MSRWDGTSCHRCGRTRVPLVVLVRSGRYRVAFNPKTQRWDALQRWLRPQDTPQPLRQRMTAVCLMRADCIAFMEARRARQALRSRVPADVLGRELHPDQQATCKWCGGTIYRKDKDGRIVLHKQRRWHDGREVDPRAHPEPNCLEEYQALKPYNFRSAVHARDNGVCAGCGRDVDAELKTYAAARKRLDEEWREVLDRLYWNVEPRPSQAVFMRLAQQQREAEARWHRDHPEPRWEADHVVPLEDGGGHLLSNAQTLCVECHRAKTAHEATARAERRRFRRDEWELTMELDQR